MRGYQRGESHQGEVELTERALSPPQRPEKLRLTGGHEPFDPARQTGALPDGDWREGKGRRKVLEPVPSVMLHWPDGAKERRDLVKAWHALAMAQVDRAKVSFRLMAVLKDFVHWKTGVIFPTNATLADRAGQCSERTVSRLIGQYEDLGIIRLRFGWRKGRAGNWLQTRVIFMTLPKSLGFPNHLPEIDEEDQDAEIRLDTGGLGENPGEVDTGGPGVVDTGGLSTNEGHSEKESRHGETA